MVRISVHGGHGGGVDLLGDDLVGPKSHLDAGLDVGRGGLGGKSHRHVLATAGHAAGEVEVVGAVGQGDADALGVGDVAVGLALMI